MPKSKRNKIVHLTQVKKKGKDHKDDLMKQLEDYVNQHEFVYIFDFDQTKSDRIMNLRLKMKSHGRIFAGRNSLVSLTLKAIGTKSNTNYSRLLKYITGHRGLLFTNLSSEKLIATLEAEQQEFRDKLLGYASLKTPDDDTVERSDRSEEDEEGEENTNQKYISFRPIKRMKKAKKQQRGGAGKQQEEEEPEDGKEQDDGIEVDGDD